jgi:hypothetical protein
MGGVMAKLRIVAVIRIKGHCHYFVTDTNRLIYSDECLTRFQDNDEDIEDEDFLNALYDFIEFTPDKKVGEWVMKLINDGYQNLIDEVPVPVTRLG